MNKNTKNSTVTFFLLFFTLIACTSKQPVSSESEIKSSDLNAVENVVPIPVVEDSLILSKQHHPNFILLDLDGDKRRDTVKMVLNENNNKYGLKIIFGNQKLAYLGLGKDVLNQGFDDLEWVGIFEKATKGEVYYNNVVDGEIISEDQVEEADKITLPNDGIFIHAAESCGGGIIYMNRGKFEWIQQE